MLLWSASIWDIDHCVASPAKKATSRACKLMLSAWIPTENIRRCLVRRVGTSNLSSTWMVQVITQRATATVQIRWYDGYLTKLSNIYILTSYYWTINFSRRCWKVSPWHQSGVRCKLLDWGLRNHNPFKQDNCWRNSTPQIRAEARSSLVETQYTLFFICLKIIHVRINHHRIAGSFWPVEANGNIWIFGDTAKWLLCWAVQKFRFRAWWF